MAVSCCPAQVADGVLKEAAMLLESGLGEETTMATRAIGYAQGMAFLRCGLRFPQKNIALWCCCVQ